MWAPVLIFVLNVISLEPTHRYKQPLSKTQILYLEITLETFPTANNWEWEKDWIKPARQRHVKTCSLEPLLGRTTWSNYTSKSTPTTSIYIYVNLLTSKTIIIIIYIYNIIIYNILLLLFIRSSYNKLFAFQSHNVSLRSNPWKPRAHRVRQTLTPTVWPW